MKKRNLPHAPFDHARRALRLAGEEWRICRWCGGGLTGRQHGWCSQGCVDEFLIRRDPGFARRKVAERDLGICAMCGKDTDALYQFWSRRPWHDNVGLPLPLRHALYRAWIRLFIDSLGCGPQDRTTIPVGKGTSLSRIGGYWDMDHIKPVVHGGGGCGLDNLRTLCIRCHKSATAELARERARHPNPQRELFDN